MIEGNVLGEGEGDWVIANVCMKMKDKHITR